MLVGLDAHEIVEPEDWIPTMHNHAALLLRRPEFKSSTLVLMIENMSGSDAGFIRMHMEKKFRNIIVMHEKGTEKTGIPTDAAVKRNMVVMMRQRMQQSLMRISAHVTSARNNANENLARLATQLKTYVRVKKAGAEPHMPVRESYTGKVGGAPDDMATMLMWNNLQKDVFLTAPEYEHLRHIQIAH